MLQSARREALARELKVLDSQRRGIVAALKRLEGRRVNTGSVTDRALAYLRRFGSAATTKELADFILSARPELNRTAIMIALYRCARLHQIVRKGRGWVLPESGADDVRDATPKTPVLDV